jgi:hypothetical protein
VWAALERFLVAAKCAREEANYYLEEHDFDVQSALAAFRADLEWEKSAPKPQKVTTKSNKTRRNY